MIIRKGREGWRRRMGTQRRDEDYLHLATHSNTPCQLRVMPRMRRSTLSGCLSLHAARRYTAIMSLSSLASRASAEEIQASRGRREGRMRRM